MNNDPSQSLSYGQQGIPSYQQFSTRWHFQVEPRICSTLAQQVVRPSFDPLKEVSARENGHSRESRKRGVRSVLHKESVLSPARQYLPQLVHASEFVEEATIHGDLRCSGGVAMGSARNDVDCSADTIPILACATGTSSDFLQIVVLTAKARSEYEFLEPGLGILGTCKVPVAEWRHPASQSILQIEFLQGPHSDKSYMAVRTSRGLTLFQPLFQTTFSYGDTHGHTPKRQHQLDPFPFLNVPFDDFQEPDYRDVSFNPWKPEQLALLSGNGGFKIISFMEPRESRNASVWILNHHHNLKHKTAATESAWGRIIWVGNRTTIATCFPRRLAVFVVGPQIHQLNTPELHLVHPDDRFLQLQRDPNNSGSMYVLTERQLLCIRISYRSYHGWTEGKVSRPRIELVWKHYRHHEGLLFTIAPLMFPRTFSEEPQSELSRQTKNSMAMLYSWNSPLVTVLELSNQDLTQDSIRLTEAPSLLMSSLSSHKLSLVMFSLGLLLWPICVEKSRQQASHHEPSITSSLAQTSNSQLLLLEYLDEVRNKLGDLATLTSAGREETAVKNGAPKPHDLRRTVSSNKFSTPEADLLRDTHAQLDKVSHTSAHNEDWNKTLSNVLNECQQEKKYSSNLKNLSDILKTSLEDIGEQTRGVLNLLQILPKFSPMEDLSDVLTCLQASSSADDRQNQIMASQRWYNSFSGRAEIITNASSAYASASKLYKTLSYLWADTLPNVLSHQIRDNIERSTKNLAICSIFSTLTIAVIAQTEEGSSEGADQDTPPHMTRYQSVDIGIPETSSPSSSSRLFNTIVGERQSALGKSFDDILSAWVLSDHPHGHSWPKGGDLDSVAVHRNRGQLDLDTDTSINKPASLLHQLEPASTPMVSEPRNSQQPIYLASQASTSTISQKQSSRKGQRRMKHKPGF